MVKMIYPFIFILFLTLPAHAGKRLTLVMTPGPPIFSAAEVLKVAYAKIGIEVEILQVPAKRAMEDMVTGVVDGDVGRIAGLDSFHDNIIQIKIPINTADAVATTCGDSIKINGKRDLKGLRIGIHSGIIFAAEITRGMDVVTIATWHTLFDLLREGRVDVVISSPAMVEEQRRRPGMECLTIQKPPLQTHNVYHYLNKRRHDIIPQITKVLQKMKDSGEMAEILARPVKFTRPDQQESTDTTLP